MREFILHVMHFGVNFASKPRRFKLSYEQWDVDSSEKLGEQIEQEDEREI